MLPRWPEISIWMLMKLFVNTCRWICKGPFDLTEKMCLSRSTRLFWMNLFLLGMIICWLPPWVSSQCNFFQASSQTQSHPDDSVLHSPRCATQHGTTRHPFAGWQEKQDYSLMTGHGADAGVAFSTIKTGEFLRVYFWDDISFPGLLVPYIFGNFGSCCSQLPIHQVTIQPASKYIGHRELEDEGVLLASGLLESRRSEKNRIVESSYEWKSFPSFMSGFFQTSFFLDVGF